MPMILESNQNHVVAKETEVCPSLPASMGLGGGYVPMIVGTITMNSYQVITESDEPIAPILNSDAHRGGGVAVVMSYQNTTGCLNPWWTSRK